MPSGEGDLEEVMSHLGEFGRYQFGQFVLHVGGALTAGLHMLTLVTVAATPPHHCDVPGNASLLGECHYLDAENATRECSSWSYDTTYFKSSRVMQWDLVCTRRWMGSLAQSAYMFGVFFGAVSLGSLADRHGRKIVFYVSAVAQLVLGVGVAFVDDYPLFVLLRFLYGIFGSAGAYITGFVLSMELVGASRRTLCGIVFQVAFATGFMLVAAWGALIPERRWLQVAYGLHSALLLGHWWLMDESPRWLWAQGRLPEALRIVQGALRTNGSKVRLDPERYLARARSAKELEEPAPRYGALDLFRTPNLRAKSLNVCLNWFANSIVYYGLSLNTGSLEGNPYLMMFLSGLVEVPSYLLCILLMDRTGRRGLVSTLMLLGGLCCISAATLPLGAPSAATAVVLFGKACIAGSFAIIYNYSAELFPTVLRNTALGIGSMCARLSGSLTPMIMLLDSLDPQVPAVAFGLIALVAGFMALYLPETLDHPMPESLEDGENFGKGDTCFSACLNPRKPQDNRPYEAALQRLDDCDLVRAEKSA